MTTHRAWQPPRLRDVARAAGVSPATVSRVLSASRPVDFRTSRAVYAAADDLGYRYPNRSPLHDNIAVLSAAIDRFGYSDTLTGIIEAARDEGLLVAIHIVENSRPDYIGSMLDRVLALPLVGIIVLDFDSVSEGLTYQLPAAVPTTIAGGLPETSTDHRSHCYIDDRSAARKATQALVNTGHTTIGYLGVPQAGHPETRELGWRDALESSGLATPPLLGIGWSASRGRRAAEYLVEHPEITAVFCGNDELAIGLIAGLSALGVRVPQDISVLGFDDHPLAEHCQPPLSTVKQDFVELGRTATALLIDLAARGIAKQHSVPTRLIQRSSTSPPRQTRDTRADN